MENQPTPSPTLNPTPAQSPLPKPRAEDQGSIAMDFPSAIKEVTVGKKIHKLEWSDRAFYGIVDGGTLKLHKPDGKFYQWVISDGDLAGNDWIVIA